MTKAQSVSQPWHTMGRPRLTWACDTLQPRGQMLGALNCLYEKMEQIRCQRDANGQLALHCWGGSRGLKGEFIFMPGIGLMVRVVCLGSLDPELKSHSLFN